MLQCRRIEGKEESRDTKSKSLKTSDKTVSILTERMLRVLRIVEFWVQISARRPPIQPEALPVLPQSLQKLTDVPRIT